MPIVVTEPGKISLPILGAAFSLRDSPQMDFSSIIPAPPKFRDSLKQRDTEHTAIFSGPAFKYPSRPLAGLLRLRQEVETLLAWSVLQQSKRIGFRASPTVFRQPITAAGR